MENKPDFEITGQRVNVKIYIIVAWMVQLKKCKEQDKWLKMKDSDSPEDCTLQKCICKYTNVEMHINIEVCNA